jgi:hypothetical protein
LTGDHRAERVDRESLKAGAEPLEDGVTTTGP